MINHIYKIARKAFVVFSICVLAATNTLPVSALSDFWSDSEIQFYDPTACDPGGSSTEGDDSAPTGSGGWSIQSGTPTNITPAFRKFMDKVAQYTSYEPIITTSTNGNHTEGSDHYSGNAGDFGSVLNNFGTNNAQPGQDVPRGDSLAAAGLIAAGVSASQAKQKAKQGGLWNENTRIDGKSYRVQVIWKSDGHFDHVHIGIKATSSSSNSGGLESFASLLETPTAYAAEDESSTGGLVGETDVEKVYNHLIELGLPAKATAGMVGNLVFESGASTGFRTSEDLNPRSTNGTHSGIAQWSHSSRWPKMQSFASSSNQQAYSLKAQTEFIWHELENDASGYPVLDLIKDASPSEAAKIINEKYEITATQSGRAEAASYFYNKYKEGGGAVSSDGEVVGCCPNGDGGNVSDLAPGSGSPTGVTFPRLNPESMASGIDKYIKKTNSSSELKGAGAKIVAGAEASDINPFLIVSIAQMESGLARPGDYNIKNANNAFGRTATQSQPNHYSASVGRYWYKWTSVHNSVDHTASENSGNSGDIAEYIRNSGFYDKGLASGKLYDIMSVYAPPSENDTQQYVRNVQSWMKRMAKLSAGGEVSGSEDTTPDPETPVNSCGVCTDPTAGSDGSGANENMNDWHKIYQTNPSISRAMDKGDLSNPKAIIIHFTAGSTEGAPLLTSMANSSVGVQFNVGKTGKIYQSYPLDDMKVTHHVAGNNSRAIGIEITGKDGKALINNDKQFDSVVALTKKLIEKYDIPANDPVGLITGSNDPSKTQGLLGHGETASNGHNRTDPDSYDKNGAAYRLTDDEPWSQPRDNKDSSKHGYMIKLRKALGLDPTPGRQDSSETGSPTGESSDCAESSGAETNDLNANKNKFSAILDLPEGAKGVSQLGFFDQCDSRWGSQPYPYASGGSNSICASACGPSSMAMVISTIGNKFVTVREIANKSKRFHPQGGTAMSRAAPAILPEYGLKAENLGSSASSKAKIIQTIESGGLVIYNAGAASPFTNAGHFIVIRAVSNDGKKFWVGDPNNHNQKKGGKNGKSYTFDDLFGGGWINPDGFWGVTKK